MSTINDLFKAMGIATDEHHASGLSFEAMTDTPAGIGQVILNVRN